MMKSRELSKHKKFHSTTRVRIEVIRENEELKSDHKLSDCDLRSPRSVLGIDSQSEINWDEAVGPVKLFKRLRDSEDLVPRRHERFIDPYEKDESSS